MYYIVSYLVIHSYRLFCILLYFFFFKQKTAYEMRISDWSSDVCSSDLLEPRAVVRGEQAGLIEPAVARHSPREIAKLGIERGGFGITQRRALVDARDPVLGQPRRDLGAEPLRSEERRVGKWCGSTCRSRC